MSRFQQVKLFKDGRLLKTCVVAFENWDMRKNTKVSIPVNEQWDIFKKTYTNQFEYVKTDNKAHWMFGGQ